jgi:hypothetical protein
MKTMTKREFLETIIASEMDESVIAYAKIALNKLNTPSKKEIARKEENAMLLEKMIEFCKDTPKTGEEIANKFSVTPQRVSSILGKSGEINKTFVLVNDKPYRAYITKEVEDTKED